MANIDEKLGQNITQEIESHEDEISKHGGIGISFDDIVGSSLNEETNNLNNKNNNIKNYSQNTINDEVEQNLQFENSFNFDEINNINKSTLNDIELLDSENKNLEIKQNVISTDIIGDEIRFNIDNIDFTLYDISVSYSNGELEILNDGQFIYTPEIGFIGDTDLIIEATNQDGERFSTNITITLNENIEDAIVKVGDLVDISLETVNGTLNIIDEAFNDNIENTVDESTIDAVAEQTVDSVPENTIPEQTVSKIDEETIPEQTVDSAPENTIDFVPENSVPENTIEARDENTVDESTIDNIPENTVDESTIEEKPEETIPETKEDTKPEETNETVPENTIGENTVSEIPEETKEAVLENTIDESTNSQVDEVTNDEQTIDFVPENTTPEVAEQTVEEQTIDEIIGGGAEDTKDEQTVAATSDEVIDIEALKSQGITQNEDGKFYKIDGQKQIEQEFTKQETHIVEVEPIMKKGFVEQEVEILGKEYIDNGTVVDKKSTISFDFKESTSNIEIDFSNFNKGTAKISFYNENGDKVGNTINQSHINDTRGYSVPQGAVGVSIKNNTNSDEFEINTISYRAESTFETTVIEGLVPDVEVMEQLGYFYSDLSAVNKNGDEISNIGDIGEGNVKGFNPMDNESQTISLGKDFANREVTISIEVDVKGSWDYNGSNILGSTNDIFTISSNKIPLETYHYSSSRSYNNTELDNSKHTYEYKVYLDENGDVELNFMVASTASNEVIDINSIDVSFESANGWYKQESVDMVYTDTVIVDNIVEIAFEDLPKTTIDIPEETVEGYENYGDLAEQTIDENTLDGIPESTIDAIPENTIPETIVRQYQGEETVDEQTVDAIPEDTINAVPEQTNDEQTVDAIEEQTISEIVNTPFKAEDTISMVPESTIDEQTIETVPESTIDEQTIDPVDEQTFEEQTIDEVDEQTSDAIPEDTNEQEIIQQAQGENTVDESTIDEIAEQTIDSKPESTIDEQTIEESNTEDSSLSNLNSDFFEGVDEIDLSSVSNIEDDVNSLDKSIFEEDMVSSENISSNINEIESLINNNDSGDVL